jgi:hypothetical protein
MTESTFPFEAAGDEPDETPGSKRKLAVVGGAGALAVAVLGYFVVVPMLSGGGDEAPSVTGHRKPAVTAADAKATAAKAAAKPAAKPAVQPASYNDVSARQDPFKPLVVEPVEAPVAAPPAEGTGTGTGTGAVPPVEGTTSGSTSGGTSTGSTSVGGMRVALVTVYAKDGKQYAQTKVGDKVYTPLVGEVFAGTYKLLATNGKTATYLFGDEQFSLSEGQEVLK